MLRSETRKISPSRGFSHLFNRASKKTLKPEGKAWALAFDEWSRRKAKALFVRIIRPVPFALHEITRLVLRFFHQHGNVLIGRNPRGFIEVV